jgi:hypothetical protein
VTSDWQGPSEVSMIKFELSLIVQRQQAALLLAKKDLLHMSGKQAANLTKQELHNIKVLSN